MIHINNRIQLWEVEKEKNYTGNLLKIQSQLETKTKA